MNGKGDFNEPDLYHMSMLRLQGMRNEQMP